MNIFKVIFTASVIAFTSVSYSSGYGDKIFTSDYIKGALKYYHIKVHVKMRDEDEGMSRGAQDLYGQIITSGVNGYEGFRVWNVPESRYINNNNNINLEFWVVGTDNGDDNYFKMTGEMYDWDRFGGNEWLCNILPDHKFYQRNIGKKDYKVFEESGENECDYINILEFEEVQ
ncbi:hypothetical protein [Vibrio aestuarianus]|uniref:hypothetical protein n=1 Tax=Vibrio aestuarianus TaxID=28171 RepID=UPI00237CF2F5|nr:hypothetical protein [Vibrio aestuarianus]MDE1262738.1 hypothetical protein [Vibrio aestuarianus]MDE1295125.1 hypothetical protein [Vibrio aestuarianus]MDE1334805.1 hypothetical protein [Vibrio aestuarianus]